MVSTRGTKRKLTETQEVNVRSPECTTISEKQARPSGSNSSFVRGEIWFEDGNVILVAARNVAFKVRSHQFSPQRANSQIISGV